MLAAVGRFLKSFLKGQGGGGTHLTNSTGCAPLTGPDPRKPSRTFNLWSAQAHPDTFIVICLCYKDLKWPDGRTMDIEGPRSDLLLFLSHMKYRHDNEHRQFLIFADFPVDFKDYTGVSRRINTMPATHHDIATRVEWTMRGLERKDKCVLYYGGHIELDPPQANDGRAYMLLQNNERIYDHELRGWLGHSRSPTATITAIFDACHSGGFLGLPYVLPNGARRMKRCKTTFARQMKSQVIEISSTNKSQLSFSEKHEGDQDSSTQNGVLTWSVIHYLKANPRPKFLDFVSHIRSYCNVGWFDENNQEWRQMPSFSASRKISGSVWLL